MCYSVSYLTHKNEIYARRLGISGDEKISFFDQLDEVRNYLGVAWYKSGFESSGLPVLTLYPEVKVFMGFWGLIPHWAKWQYNEKMIKHTLNARIESLLERPSFKYAAVKNRCIILLDGFFEYKHIAKKAYPYFIKHHDDKPMLVGGIYEIAPEHIPFPVTISIVTRPGNKLMAEIHNNSLSGEPRMPLILEDEYLLKWTTLPVKDAIKECINLQVDNLKAIPVGQLKGKKGIGNNPEAHLDIRHNSI